MDELKCPGCQHPVGEPVRPGEPLHKKKPISDTDMLICFKCFEVMQGTKEGTLRILTAKERTYCILFKPGFIQMLRVVWAAQGMVKNAGN